MFVNSTTSLSFPLPLHAPQSQLDDIALLVNEYLQDPSTKEKVIEKAREKITLWMESSRDEIDVVREGLCKLLKLQIEELQSEIIKTICAAMSIAFFLDDISQLKIRFFIDLEQEVSALLDTHVHHKKDRETLSFLLALYQNIIYWLALHALLMEDPTSQLAITQVNLSTKEWFFLLLKEKDEESFTITAKEIANTLEQIQKPLSSSLLETIEKMKSEPKLAFLQIGTLCTKMGNWKQATDCYKYALLRCESIRPLRQYFLNQMNSEFFAGSKDPRAVETLCKLLKIAQEEKKKENQIDLYIALGELHYKQQNEKQAQFDFQKALEVAQSLSKDELVNTHKLLSTVYFRNGNCPQAANSLEQVQLLSEDKDITLWTRLGVAFIVKDQYSDALCFLQKGLKIARKQENNSLQLAKIHKELGGLYMYLGDFSRGKYHFEKALRKFQSSIFEEKEIPNSFGAELIEQLAYMDNSSGKKDLARAGYSFVSMFHPRDEDSPKTSSDYYKKGHLLLSQRNFHEAIKQYEKGLRLDQEHLETIDDQLTFGLVEACLEAKEHIKAIEYLQKVIPLYHAQEELSTKAEAHYSLGLFYILENDLNAAKECFKNSIDDFFIIQKKIESNKEWNITFFERQARAYLGLEFVLIKQQNKGKEEALSFSDFRRSRTLVSALTEKYKVQKDHSLSSSRLKSQEMQTFAHKLNTCFIIYSFVSESTDLKNASTDYITAWVIPPQGEITCQQLPLGILTEEVKETTQVFKTFPFIVEPTVAKRRPFIRPKKTRGSATYTFLDELTRGDSDESTNSAVLQTFKERLSLWYETLIAPLESYLPKDPQQVVTIIPDGFLAQIPFAAFLDKEGTYLIEKHPISIAPSIGILKLLDEIPKNFSENSLVIGNPATPHSKDALPLAEKEAQTIVAPLLATTSERTLLQDNATAQRALEGMRDARWIHLACHGSTGAKPEEKLDPHSVFEGLFKLAPDEEHIQGYLHAQEIVPLTLRTELVFMSACFSGRGKLHREGSVGPVWSFLAAGALSTVATYWRLPDSDLTLQMVDTFYRHLLGIEVEKLNKAQALQKAMLMAIEQKREKPHLWGAFFLSGLHE
ncbi:CHAT domain-containing protein [Candidatus Protochlamydia amoebophila]|uniref:CHAT domain-containing protein n=1 Tax=Protochlamydia amoebophila (strain UWE25) TaxID=264201 RepID=Q6MF79_PARUW|nr:CHAT domain-containing protein [Candidatus Protochlamydia amoebophila]CAF22770.1 unnamed protein product [Candidatus Protochlamydia amoebophila UWE25]